MTQNRIVAFIDILGFSQSIELADEAKLIVIHNLLRQFQESNRRQATKVISGQALLNLPFPMPVVFATSVETGHSEMIADPNTGFNTNIDESFAIQTDPEITSFSDCVAISHSLDFGAQGDAYIRDVVMSRVIDAISEFGYFCLDKGFLIRGGIALGLLTHEANLIFGRAFLEAYRAEQKAKYPRVILAESALFAAAPSSQFANVISSDVDEDNGITYQLNWMLAEGARSVLTQINRYPRGLHQRLHDCGRHITHNLVHFQSEQQTPENRKNYNKWLWFAHHFNEFGPKVLERYGEDLSDFRSINLT